MAMNRKAYMHARIFDGFQFHEGQALLCDGPRVAGLVPEASLPPGYEPVKLAGAILAPAFIDLQIYGAYGKMFSEDTTEETLEAVYEYCKSGGAAYCLITLATNRIEKFVEGMEVVRSYLARGGKGILGLHLEGPYLNAAKRGAHVAEYIKTPTREEILMLIEKGRGVLKMMTLAPECCDPAEVGLLQEAGILVSAGHSNATYAEAMDAFNRGIPAATHLFNAMSPFQHRAPGIAGAILDHPRVCCSVVCDGIHVDYAAVRIAKAVMHERLFYITDAVAATPSGSYPHVFRGDHYTLPNGTLSGSALTMMQSVRNGVEQAGISLGESLRMATRYPAALLPDRPIGTLQPGAEASLVVFDDTFRVLQVITA